MKRSLDSVLNFLVQLPDEALEELARLSAVLRQERELRDRLARRLQAQEGAQGSR